ncbi:hypothetical protein C8Q80DRAFT_1124794 [Daedaleopsis nitida]|nr:hypothetical protein C8Q80DRAFT_1124794 [Daedaleopsis nitida]
MAAFSQALVLFSEPNVKFNWIESGKRSGEHVRGVRLVFAQCSEAEYFLAVCNENAMPPSFAQPVKLPDQRLHITSDETHREFKFRDVTDGGEGYFSFEFLDDLVYWKFSRLISQMKEVESLRQHTAAVLMQDVVNQILHGAEQSRNNNSEGVGEGGSEHGVEHGEDHGMRIAGHGENDEGIGEELGGPEDGGERGQDRGEGDHNGGASGAETDVRE